MGAMTISQANVSVALAFCLCTAIVSTPCTLMEGRELSCGCILLITSLLMNRCELYSSGVYTSTGNCQLFSKKCGAKQFISSHMRICIQEGASWETASLVWSNQHMWNMSNGELTFLSSPSPYLSIVFEQCKFDMNDSTLFTWARKDSQEFQTFRQP